MTRRRNWVCYGSVVSLVFLSASSEGQTVSFRESGRPRTEYPVSSYPRGIASGDFNGDGLPDVAAGSYSAVSVLLAAPDGTGLQPARDYPVGGYPVSVAVGDVNNDGKLDIVSANSYNVSLLLGNGDGTFQSPRTTNLGSSAGSIASGDFDGDGRMDLAIVASGSVQLLLS